MKGFSLIEILLSLVILSIGLIGVITFYPVLSKGTVKQEEKILAVNLARQKLEQIMTLSFVSISTGNPAALSDTVVLQGKNQTRRVDVLYVDSNNNEVAGPTNLKKIRVILAGYKTMSLKANY